MTVKTDPETTLPALSSTGSWSLPIFAVLFPNPTVRRERCMTRVARDASRIIFRIYPKIFLDRSLLRISSILCHFCHYIFVAIDIFRLLYSFLDIFEVPKPYVLPSKRHVARVSSFLFRFLYRLEPRFELLSCRLCLF